MSASLPNTTSHIGEILHYNQKRHYNRGFVKYNLKHIDNSTKGNIFAENLYYKAKHEPATAGWLLQPYNTMLTGVPLMPHSSNITAHRYQKKK